MRKMNYFSTQLQEAHIINVKVETLLTSKAKMYLQHMISLYQLARLTLRSAGELHIRKINLKVIIFTIDDVFSKMTILI